MVGGKHKVLVHYVDISTPDLLRTTVASAVHEYYISLFTILLMFFYNVCKVKWVVLVLVEVSLSYSTHYTVVYI